MDIHTLIEQTVNPDEYIYGYADLTGLLHPRYRAYPHAISLGRKLDDAVIDELQHIAPTRRYYDLYLAVNEELARVLDRLSRELRAAGIDTVKIKPTFEDGELDDKYRATLVTDFSHKMAATRAGLGWIGKTDLFVSERFGPRVRLATLLTADDLPPAAAPCDESRCGPCDICVRRCPARAANGALWKAGMERGDFFDAFKCRDKCRELAMKELGIHNGICGICVAVCPVGKGERSVA